MWNIDLNSQTIEMVPEYLDINELRSELDDTPALEASEIIDVVNDAVEDAVINIPDELPDATDASEGDVLVLNSDKEPVWETPSAGSGGTSVYLHKFTSSGYAKPILYVYSNQSTPYITTSLTSSDIVGINDINSTIGFYIKLSGYRRRAVLTIGVGNGGTTFQTAEDYVGQNGVITAVIM